MDKFKPDRSLSDDKRVVHDQREFNESCPKETHPPAVQPYHRQVARQLLWWTQRYPGIPIYIAKRDVNGAFRLLWLAPQDTELFTTTLPWRPEEMEAEAKEEGPVPRALKKAVSYVNMLVVYLVLSFGWSGSPGEWTAIPAP